MTRGAQGRILVLGIEPGVHARRIVGRRDQTGERLARLSFEIGRESRRCARPRAKSPSARRPRPASSSARARAKCPLAERGGSLAKNAITACGSVRSCHSAASARRRRSRDARPARIGGDEGVIAREIARPVFAAQDHPFHELARQRIGDGAFDVGRFVLAVLAHEIDRLLDRRQIDRRCCRGRRENEGRGSSRGMIGFAEAGG